MSAAIENDPTNRIRKANVRQVDRLSPGMVRITLAGEDLLDFTGTGVGDEYVRLFFPKEGETHVVMPFISGDYWEYPEGVEAGPMRTYTIRAVPEPGVVVIDFVVHEGGVAAAWALRAAPGDEIAFNPPKPLYEPPAGTTWQLLLADATGLPALARILEQTPAHVRTRAVIEIGHDDHRIPLATPANVDVVWSVGGNGHGPGTLPEALRSLTLPDGEGYVWFAGESRAQRAVRKHLRHELKLPAGSYKTIGYWTEKAEEWRERWDNLDDGLRAQLDGLWADESRDQEEIIDEVEALYESVGL